MSDYAAKLSALLEKRQSLIEEESKLIEKRKKEIGNLAERFNLLTVPDAVIVGLFHEVRTAVDANPEKIKDWETRGASVVKAKRVNSKEASVLES